jgi:hypothetical protein
VWGHSTRHVSTKEVKFCKINRSNPWTQSADTPVRIILYKYGYRLHPNTVKQLWQQDLPAVPGEFTLRDYHGQQDRYQARVLVIKLYYQGWHKLSISRVLHVSRPTVDRWIARFEAEHFAGWWTRAPPPRAQPARFGCR